jgi:anti-sigma B factor antagonist
MTDANIPLVQWSRVDGVAVVEILSRQIQDRDVAGAIGKDLRSLLLSGEIRLLLDFGRTRLMSSSAFGALLIFAKQVAAVDGELRICSMDPAVRFGANVCGLGRFVPIHADQPSALAAFARKGMQE